MNRARKNAGVALMCAADGRIVQVLGEHLCFSDRFVVGHLFSSCLANGSMGKSLDFLSHIRTEHVAFDWEMQMASNNDLGEMLCFDGCMVDGHALILGAATSRELVAFLDDLMGMHNDQINTERLALKALVLKEAAAGRVPHDVYNDLTRLNNELANAHRQLAKQNSELERLNRLKTQFLGMAAHDLRSPIGNILSLSGFLHEEAGELLSAEHLEFLSIIQSLSTFMMQLVSDFLDVSAIESGHLALNRQTADIRKLLERHVGLNSTLADAKKIHVALHIEGELPMLCVDSDKIAQVLNNLISNAVKFSQPGTQVLVYAVEQAGGVRIEVRDQGQGIPEHERSKLFQPFGKTSVRGTDGETSTGLGLAIVRKIVEGHGGRIWLESQIAVGSVFAFTLPAWSGK